MNFAGLDPDKNGAIALINSEYKILELVDMPVMDTGRSGTMRYGYDIGLIAALLDEFTQDHGPFFLTIEEPIIWTAKRRNAESSSGDDKTEHKGNQHLIWMGYGICLGVVVAKQIKHQRALPSVWKPKMNIPKGSDKKGSIPIAKELFPETASERMFMKPRGRVESLHGRADALLLAVYGLRKHSSLKDAA